MVQGHSPIPAGAPLRQRPAPAAAGSLVTLLGETFYRIQHADALPPFLISLVSSSDHWLYIASTGGLTAGRVSADQALFPYYTEDKLLESGEHTGSKIILRVERAGAQWLWEPFSIRAAGHYRVERSLYKNVAGTCLIFEEFNWDLELSCRYAWRPGERFGFVKTTWLRNLSASPAACQVTVLDGLQNLLPAQVSADMQLRFSCLLDAYKRSELEPRTGLGVFALNATLTDAAQPSESLLATTVFQTGLEPDLYLLSSAQLDRFRAGDALAPETETRGVRGAYFVGARLALPAGAEHTWHLVADVSQDGAAIARTRRALREERAALSAAVERDLRATTGQLRALVARADGVQLTASALRTARHFANVMFNVMRGGLFEEADWVRRADFVEFVRVRNRALLADQAPFLEALPERLPLAELHQRARQQGDPDLRRLTYNYLPLTFSRRHGDPSRPWNRFVINLRNPDGTQRLDYEGNWRDIFQNWEALAYTYPAYLENMIATFLCATTADGYNPYRLTRAGVDWEIPEPGNPWANIGYWSDHQIIYLQKLLEASHATAPGRLRAWLAEPVLSDANVPYRIKPYAEVVADPYATILFDHDLHQAIAGRVAARGTDGQLVWDASGRVVHRSLAEKLLLLLLAKLTNYVPEGGLWMNTQRPEWNDANNALVGKGLSVVTLGYLRRYVVFFRELLAQAARPTLPFSAEVARLFGQVAGVLQQFQPLLAGAFTDAQRRTMLDALGQAGSDYRWQFYRQGVSGETAGLSTGNLLAFLELALRYIDHSLRANRRPDGLYHAYNLLHLRPGEAAVTPLYEMLEGQVAILSSGLLSATEALALLRGLRASALYRPDQHTYLLYPDRPLTSLLHKNTLTPEQVGALRLPALLAEAGDTTLLVRDVDGNDHFAGAIHNASDVQRALDALAAQPRLAAAAAAERADLLRLFEALFHHTEFTGRSGTFFAYEGLGSVYWHMVAKLLLAVQEVAWRYRAEPEGAALRACYQEIRAGLGFNKTPAEYGAFPPDPYSHTPKAQGARQPGMTGAVKEEILARWAEVGVRVEAGQLTFTPWLVDADELLRAPGTFAYLDVAGRAAQVEVPAGALAFTVCQTPVVLQRAAVSAIHVQYADGTTRQVDGPTLDVAASQHILARDGVVRALVVHMAL